MEITTEFKNELQSAFIDATIVSNNINKPEFICNNYKQGRKVISTIEQELLHCTSFDISVAFITDSGVTPLLQTLKECQCKGIKGRILTTDYSTFTQPNALKKLHQLSNIELKMYRCASKDGFHTKGYIFHNDKTVRFVIGSSNLTGAALTVNHEWNSKLVSTPQGEYALEVLDEFNQLWNSSQAQSYVDFIDSYTYIYESKQAQLKAFQLTTPKNYNIARLQPNKMQVQFIHRLKELIKKGAKRALLISATGTGKTYASAFALRELNPKRALFLIHREQIAIKSMESYKNVFGTTKTMGVLSGNSKSFDKDIIFSTMQTMAKEDILNQFAHDAFDLIVIDEAHRVGAHSYLKIMDYFKPKFYLGMSASPDRTDGFDVYQQFDHNIAAEIRLQQALEEDLLCPFHYFGIKDIFVSGESLDLNEFNYLTKSERVDYVIENIQYYGYSGEKVHGLIFVSRNEEAKYFSEQFNLRGYKTTVLTGSDSQEKRMDAIRRLESNGNDALDYILTVDIFNEGIDIPCVNQVVMLRPTQSAIVFVQQLGRGLRKNNNKEYVVIIDFIGNYQTNFLIPIALSGDNTYNKDNIRRYIMSGERIIPGTSTIHFDEISKQEIFKSIDNAKFSDTKIIKESYFNLKNKLGKIPTLLDFDRYEAIDPLLIFNNKSLGSYHNFLVKYDKDYSISLNSSQCNVLEFISQRFANGKRMNELLLIDILVNYPCDDIFKLYQTLMINSNYTQSVTLLSINNLINQFTNNFLTGSSANRYYDAVLIQEVNGKYKISDSFKQMLTNDSFKHMVNELIAFGKNRYFKYFDQAYDSTDFVLYSKYTYDDVCRLLNWEKSEVALNIGGYKFDLLTNTYPIFINYHKDNDIADSIKYEDHFLSNDNFVGISKSKRDLNSDDVKHFIHSKENETDVHLFVRKNKDDKTSKEFYYLGKVNYRDSKQMRMQSGESIVEFLWRLDVPVREDIYEYIINN